MNLKEILEKATPRPWKKYFWKDLVFFLIDEAHRAEGGKAMIFAEDQAARKAKVDMQLAHHAVNVLEPLLEAAKGILPWAQPSDRHPSGDACSCPVHVSWRKFQEAIHRAEEVTP